MAHFLKQVIDSYIYVFFAIFCLEKWLAFHSEAIERLCFACDNIIMKNAHLIEPSLFQNIIEAFSSNITTVENISPRNLEGSETFCEKTIRHFFCCSPKAICLQILQACIFLQKNRHRHN